MHTNTNTRIHTYDYWVTLQQQGSVGPIVMFSCDLPLSESVTLFPFRFDSFVTIETETGAEVVARGEGGAGAVARGRNRNRSRRRNRNRIMTSNRCRPQDTASRTGAQQGS